MSEEDLRKLDAAALEIRVGYTRRYGQAYKEAHVLADALPVLLEELRRWRAEFYASLEGDAMPSAGKVRTP